MSKLYLLLVGLLNTLLSLAQSNLSNTYVSESGALALDLDDQRYYTRTLEWEHFYKKSVLEYSSGRTLEEFILINQHSFLYVQYDSSGTEKCKGILLIDSARIKTDTFPVPDVERDPDLSKGIMKNIITKDYYLKKEGFWREENREGREERGAYLKDRRTGIWKVGKLTRSENYPHHWPFPWKIFKIDKTNNYIDGVADTTYSTEYTLERIWPLLQGKWNFDLDNSLREQFYYTKIELTTVPARFNFIDTLKFVVKDERKQSSNIRRWSFKNKILTIYSDYNEQDYTIIFISEKELYLAPGESRQRKR